MNHAKRTERRDDAGDSNAVTYDFQDRRYVVNAVFCEEDRETLSDMLLRIMLADAGAELRAR